VKSGTLYATKAQCGLSACARGVYPPWRAADLLGDSQRRGELPKKRASQTPFAWYRRTARSLATRTRPFATPKHSEAILRRRLLSRGGCCVFHLCNCLDYQGHQTRDHQTPLLGNIYPASRYRQMTCDDTVLRYRSVPQPQHHLKCFILKELSAAEEPKPRKSNTLRLKSDKTIFNVVPMISAHLLTFAFGRSLPAAAGSMARNLEP
jgi:hypothetical protein